MQSFISGSPVHNTTEKRTADGCSRFRHTLFNDVWGPRPAPIVDRPIAGANAKSAMLFTTGPGALIGLFSLFPNKNRH